MKGLAATFLSVPLLLAGCVVPYGGTPSPGSAATASADGLARLDRAGIAQIQASKSARLDMTSGQLTKESVGLGNGTSQAPEVEIKNGVMALSIDGPSGTVRASTDRLRLNGMNNGAGFSEITYFLTASSLADYSALVREGVDRYGLPRESAERWIESISNQPRGKSDFALGPGTSTGLNVTYDLRYDGAKENQVIIVHVNPS